MSPQSHGSSVSKPSLMALRSLIKTEKKLTIDQSLRIFYERHLVLCWLWFYLLEQFSIECRK